MRKTVLSAAGVAAGIAAAGGLAWAAAGPNTVTIPSTLQSLSVALTAPADGSTITSPPGMITVQGSAAIGALALDPIDVVFASDVSGSTSFNPGMDCDGSGAVDADDDLNGDGSVGDTLDCEIAGGLALIDTFPASQVKVGLVAFATTAAAADVSPSAGPQVFAAPGADDDADLTPDLEQVLRSLTVGSIGQFTPDATLGTGTDFNLALTALVGAFSAGRPSPPASRLAFFLSDGVAPPLVRPGPLDDAIAANITINTFSVGSMGTGCAAGTGLRTIADETGGKCTEVVNPADLVSEIPVITPAGLDRIEVNGTVVPAGAMGNFETQVMCPAMPGPFTITATAFANDPVPTSVSADVTVQCVAPPPEPKPMIDIRPKHKKNKIHAHSFWPVAVALLGAPNFDVSRADAASLRFGPRGARPVFDVRIPAVRTASTLDVNRDGIPDLVLWFRPIATGLFWSDHQACLQGTFDGTKPFKACDRVFVIP